jgi:molybdopterin/thiamine biosynthesis adenylyltransferase
MIVGVGSVGATTALSLARLQEGRLVLVDRGRFKPASLLTQPVGEESLGQPKASHIASLCRRISPRTKVEAIDEPLQHLPLSRIAGSQIVVGAGDNLTLARDLGQRCHWMSVPLLTAAVHGESLTVQTKTFGGDSEDSPCPACSFGAAERRMMEEEQIWSCEGGRVPAAEPGGTGPATMSLRPLCALAGEMAALLVVRWRLRLGASVLNILTEFSGYTWRTFVTPLRRNPACVCEHKRWRRIHSPRPLGERALQELLSVPGPRANSETSAPLLALDRYQWVERGLCGCAEPVPLQRFVALGRTRGPRCRRCRREIHPQPFYSQTSVSAERLGALLRKPLRRLGAGAVRDLLVTQGEQTFWHTNSQSKKGSGQ